MHSALLGLPPIRHRPADESKSAAKRASVDARNDHRACGRVCFWPLSASLAVISAKRAGGTLLDARALFLPPVAIIARRHRLVVRRRHAGPGGRT